MRIYLDNNATTPIHPDVLAAVTHALRETFGNASSIHEEGQRARRALEEARESVAALIHASPREVVFTSGGTESNNAAIYGHSLSGKPGYGTVTSAIEHPSVLEPLRDLAARGQSLRLVPPRRDGAVDAAEFIAAIGDDTRLVSLMLASNETGVVQPVAEVAAHCRARGIHVHCDAVQAAGKIPLDVEALGVDTLSLSAHKLHAPKGIGALYVRKGTTLHPLLAGGAQERRRRAGTENVPLAAGFGVAASLAGEALAGAATLAALRDAFEARILERFPEAAVNGAGAPRLPNTSNVRFTGSDGESIVIALDLRGVAASTGSACSSGRVEPSHVLIAMRLSEEDAKSSVRFSLSRFTTEAELSRAVELLGEIVPRSRREPAARVD